MLLHVFRINVKLKLTTI